MRKAVLVGSIVVCLLLLMAPNINAIEYQQVQSSTYETIDRLTERLKENVRIALHKPVQDENVRNLLCSLSFILDSLCFTCADDPWDPVCPILAIECMIMLLLALVFILTVILIPFASVFFNEARNTYNNARQLGCLWAFGVP